MEFVSVAKTQGNSVCPNHKIPDSKDTVIFAVKFSLFLALVFT